MAIGIAQDVQENLLDVATTVRARLSEILDRLDRLEGSPSVVVKEPEGLTETLSTCRMAADDAFTRLERIVSRIGRL